jgi:hypothetical protein
MLDQVVQGNDSLEDDDNGVYLDKPKVLWVGAVVIGVDGSHAYDQYS